jgi:hypothetical protein
MVTDYDGAAMRQWVLLAYHLPREPSRPRLALWRSLRRIGALQVNDGLVALPLDSETREQLEWLANAVVEDGGDATVLIATTATRAQERAWVGRMTAGVEREFDGVRQRADEARRDDAASRRRTIRNLRAELRRIAARDWFSADGRRVAEAAVEALAAPGVMV